MGGAYTKPYDIEIVQHAIECDDVTIFKGQLHKYISKTNNMYHESNKIRPEEIFVEEYIIQHESMEIFKYMIQKKLMRFHNVCTSNFILGHLNRKKIIKYVLQLCKKNNVVLDKPVSHKKNISIAHEENYQTDPLSERRSLVFKVNFTNGIIQTIENDIHTDSDHMSDGKLCPSGLFLIN